eukprot:9789236-Prorocentrum_lima.AAC.1
MTSSLVGSEMCIRDSPLAEPPRHLRPTCQPTFLISCVRALSHAPPLSAVSYTHLTLPTICSV